MIILATQGTGKTYAASKRSDIRDVDRVRGKENIDDYVARLIAADSEPGVLYTFGNLRHDIVEALVKAGEDVTLFAPFKEIISPEEYVIMKERIFGRLVLRKEQNQYTCKYIEDFKENYDKFNTISYYSDLLDHPGSIMFLPMYSTISTVLELLNLELFSDVKERSEFEDLNITDPRESRSERDEEKSAFFLYEKHDYNFVEIEKAKAV